jgi:hypothetical protein
MAASVHGLPVAHVTRIASTLALEADGGAAARRSDGTPAGLRHLRRHVAPMIARRNIDYTQRAHVYEAENNFEVNQKCFFLHAFMFQLCIQEMLVVRAEESYDKLV